VRFGRRMGRPQVRTAGALPCLRNPVSSMTTTPTSAARFSTTQSCTMSRSPSAYQRPRPSNGPLSPRPRITGRLSVHPAWRSAFGTQQPVRNRLADAAIRSCVNSPRIRPFGLRWSTVADLDQGDQRCHGLLELHWWHSRLDRRRSHGICRSCATMLKAIRR
jgi:hypothetical protein